VQIATVFAAALLLLGALAVLFVQQTGHADARRQVAQAAADQDAMTSPPHGTWIYEQAAGRLRVSPGAPAEPTDPRALAAVAADGRLRDTIVHQAGREYQVRTQRSGSGTVQAVLDITDAERERSRLYLALAAVGGVGLVVAAVVGAVIARRSIAPLGLALARQQRFVADASHELRTPLTQLHTRAQLVDRELRGGADLDRLREDAQQLVRGSRHLGEVVEDLLLAAQLRVAPQEFGPVDLAELAGEAVAAEQPRAVEHGVDLLVRAPSDRQYVVRGAVTALRRVLASLVDNALAHTPTQGHITISLGSDPGAGTVSCAVQDDGVGFDPADAQLIFERFARGGHGDRRRFGIGLALVRETIEAHGGTVTAVSAPGAGATFTLTLPAWRDPPAED
jgi:signal transduction histidine kinase